MSILFRLKPLSAFVFISLIGPGNVFAAEFNLDVLDAEDRSNVDLTRFSEKDYMMPGVYTFDLILNGHSVRHADFAFIERKQAEDKPGNVEACFSSEDIDALGLTPASLNKLTVWNEGKCFSLTTLPGSEMKPDLGEGTLTLSIPQAWLEYQDDAWFPPSRWEDGLPGVIFDYNMNASVTKPDSGDATRYISGTGTAGANAGPWRLRADWQANYAKTGSDSQRDIDWNRIYAYRALRGLQAKLSLGENYFTSDVFESWRYTGVSLNSDDSMLPPRLRGYAPEITGIAKTNARVVVSQQGRVLYETTVASGPFRIQDISDVVRGTLDVRVEEQDGSSQVFQVETATIPYLTRPGQLRYKLASGKPGDNNHHMQGPFFGSGEFSWGISNAWSLYGGSIIAGDYNAFVIGLGRDLLSLGAISADVTQSVARLPGEGRQQGKSWRLSYSKRFDELNSEITFAGYRFSERDYMSMNEYLNRRYRGSLLRHDKELYTVTASKTFSDARTSAYLSWSHQTYWNSEDTDRYSFSVSRYFDVASLHDISATLSVTRSDYNERTDNAAYLNLSVPFGGGTVSYNATKLNDRYTHTAGWYQRLSSGDSYRVQAGSASGGGEDSTTLGNVYYNHKGDIADMTVNTSWVQNRYTSAGMSLSGGLTATAKGAALHPGGTQGGSRMLVSTDAISHVPVENYGRSNVFGIAVIPDVASYYPVTTSIQLNKLPDDVEISGSSVAEAALTEGAIGYRQFDVLKGAKLIGIFALENGKKPPFGATVHNSKNREVGIISDDGMAWISGINPGDKLSVNWGGKTQCTTSVPHQINTDKLFFPCQK
ncbi:fimbria/pilus outer membrane usher protein [Enterobacteriaceae bacterium 4M9]|nr:fimbria/pilus outer membrane usher protein [Enterobacteriaceae bacterium 4M9]